MWSRYWQEMTRAIMAAVCVTNRYLVSAAVWNIWGEGGGGGGGNFIGYFMV